MRIEEEGLVVIVMAALEKQKHWKQWTKDGGEFIPYPASWLRAEGWTDQEPKPEPEEDDLYDLQEKHLQGERTCTMEEFSRGMDRLIGAFGVKVKEERARIYFERLSRYSGEAFSRACSEIIDNEQKFPALAVLLRVTDSKEPKQTTGWINCPECNGTGFKYLRTLALRARCTHGDKLSETILRYPDEAQERRRILSNYARAFSGVYGTPPSWVTAEGISYERQSQD